MNESNMKEEDFNFAKKEANLFEEPSQVNLFETPEDESVKLSEIKHDKKIERIQLFLILFLVVVGSLVYFFGYDLFKPFIKVD